MPHQPDAILEDGHGRPVLHFERVLRHQPERVWRALVERDELARWHPTPVELEPAVGGAARYRPHPDAPHAPPMPDGEVTEYDPPRALGHTWAGDHLRWELRPHRDGCLLVLTHTFDDRFKAARDAAGWHMCLDALASELDGGATPPRDQIDDERLPPEWSELNDAYERRFEIPPEKATPPPAR